MTTPTHEIYAYIDINNESVELTDPEPVQIDKKENVLVDSFGRTVGVFEKADHNGTNWKMPNHGTTLLIRKLPGETKRTPYDHGSLQNPDNWP